MHTLMDMLFLVKSRQQIDGFNWILENLVSFAIIKKIKYTFPTSILPSNCFYLKQTNLFLFLFLFFW